MKVRICAVQCKVGKDKDKNLENSVKFFETAEKNNCDIICFPEMFLTRDYKLLDYDADFVRNSKKNFSALCKKYCIYGIMGSIIERFGKDFFNISYLFDNKGKVIGSYKKIHLVKYNEGKNLNRGKSAEVFKTKFGKIGIQICRDLLYPEVTKELMLKGAEFVFCPAYWCSNSTGYPKLYNEGYFSDKEPREVDFLVSARAIESECVFVFVNAAGEFKDKKSHDVLLGRTQAAVPFYGTIKRIEDNSEDVLIFEVDNKIVKDARKIYYTHED